MTGCRHFLNFTRFSAVLLSAFFLVSCNDVLSEFKNSQEGELVTVNLNVVINKMNVISESDGQSLSTRSVYDGEPILCNSDENDDIVCEIIPSTDVNVGTRAYSKGYIDSGDVTDVQNLLVIQFDGTEDNAPYVKQVYIEDFQNTNTIQLVASSTQQTIVCFANTFNKTLSFANQTLGQCKSALFYAGSLDMVVSLSPTSKIPGTFPSNGEYFQRMNGLVKTTIDENTSINCILYHNACKLTVNVKNLAGEDPTYPVTLKSVDLIDIPDQIYYYTIDRDDTSVTPGYPTAEFLSTYNQSDVLVWSGDQGTSSDTKQIILYVPENQRGQIVNNSAKLKSMFAPSRSTKLRINGTFKDGSRDIPVTYTFALGGDMTKNYQLFPNHNYTYNITIKKRGDKTTDARVRYVESNGIDYTDVSVWPLSNCYICNPANVSGEVAEYKIPVARVDQFWGPRYENVQTNMLTPPGSGGGSNWTASVVWSDMKVSPENIILEDMTGTGAGGFFTVKIPHGSEMGNVIIGIKKDGNPDWLWSWHIWVTDYYPDEGKYLRQQGAFIDGTDTYSVSGGVVYRYEAEPEANIKNQKIHMDRPVGALTSKCIQATRGTLYYQYGRKDPFPYKSASVKYFDGGNVEKLDTWNKNNENEYNKTYKATDVNRPDNVRYSVLHPQTFIEGNWTVGNKYNPSSPDQSIVWNDPYSSDHQNKSIFDPCPSGWKVPRSFNFPASGIYSDGGVYASSLNTNAPANSIFIQGNGFTHTGGVSYYGHVYIYGATPVNTAVSYRLFASSTSPTVSNKESYAGYSRDFACPVIAVQE